MGTLIAVLVLIFCIVMIVVTTRMKKKEKQQKELKKQEVNAQELITVTHMSGLPLADGALCEVYLCPDKYMFKRNETTFNLVFNKVKDVTIKSETEIHNAYVSSVGGAVGGAVLFGPLGAMIGGRAKKKTDKVIHNYLIFTYDKDGATDYISLDITNCYKADKFVTAFNAIAKEKKEVQL